MAYATLVVERSGLAAHVQLNRPEVINALNQDLVDDLFGCLAELGRDRSVRVIVLSGAGRGFCAGGDVSFLEIINDKPPVEIRTFLGELFQKLTALTRMEKPVIAALHGFVMGAGFGLALHCDIRLAAESTVFGTEFVSMGLVPELGTTHILPNLTGLGRATELVLTARRFKADEAERLGIVSRVVADDRVVIEAMAMADKMAALPPLALGMAKTALRKGASPALVQSLGLEAELNALCYKTEDHREAVMAFLEKRKPEFKGC